MPTYSFYCDEGHVTDNFSSWAARPREIECQDCASPARPGVSRPKKTEEAEVSWKEKVNNYKGISLHDFQCLECNNIFEEIVCHSDGENAPEGKECPECKGHGIWLPAAKIDRFSERFPYFDRGLGVMLTSKQHRKDVCKARGFTAVEGDWDEEYYIGKQEREDNESQEAYEDYCDRLDNAPEFRHYRKSKDQGRI